MPRIICLLDRLVPPALALGLAILALTPDYLDIGTPGIGIVESLLLTISLGVLIANFFLTIRPLTALRTTLAGSRVGWREILLVTLSIMGTCVTADIILRMFLPPSYVATSKYGTWRPHENSVKHMTVEDTTGQFRQLTVRFFQHGFKRWGDPKSRKTRVMVIGDSFTEASQVSNGEEWYSYLEKRFHNVELFVFGAGGYGSLQEYLVLDDFIDTINPHMILWQFCTNDYSNNLYEFDLSSYPYNNHGVRPYLEGDRIVYRLPLPYEKLREYSFFADRILKEYDLYTFRSASRDLDAYLKNRAEKDIRTRRQLHDKAYDVTLRIMKRVRARADGIPIYIFNTCSGSSEDETHIAKEAGITFLPGIQYLNDDREGREVSVPNNGHWNKLGNQLAGERLVQVLHEMHLLEEPPPQKP